MRAVVVNPSTEPICGIPLVERLVRSLREAGVTDVQIRGEHDVDGVESGVVPVSADGGSGDLLYLDGRYYLDDRIVEAVVERSGTYLCVADADRGLPVTVADGEVTAVGPDSGTVWTGIARLDGVDRVGGDPSAFLDSLAAGGALDAVPLDTFDEYVTKLRRSVPLHWAFVTDATSKRDAEHAVLDRSKKSPSDIMAAYVHDPIEDWVVIRLADYAVTPNQVTLVVNLLAYAATALFALGYFLPASLLTLLVGVTDGFDGKLARLTEMKTDLGAMEHSFDLLYEFSWIVALGYAVSAGGDVVPLVLAGVIVTVVAFYRDLYDRFRDRTGVSLDVSSQFMRRFRRVTGRRNLYSLHILAFVLLGRPGLALYTIAGHAALTAVVYTAQTVHRLGGGDGAPA